MLSATSSPRIPYALNTLSRADLYSDSRTHGYQGLSRNVHLPRTTTRGGGVIAKCEDGIRCVVAGKESLRILRLSDSSEGGTPEHKSSVGRGGHRIDASRNFWDGSGLKIDSASTDVAWCHGGFNNKILTSARNGELIMWDLNKSGPTKYERKTKDHIRSINKLSYSTIVPHYCVTGSADGDLRVWDLRDMSKSLIRIHHPTSVRSVIFSPNSWQPLQVVVGLDNGSIYRWDLQLGQRGQLDRIAMAHTGPVLALDWRRSQGLVTDGMNQSHGMGWLATAGMDRCVKVWDLTNKDSHAHIPHKPLYTLRPSFAIRRVLWRPSYGCELAIMSNGEFSVGSNTDLSLSMAVEGTASGAKEKETLGKSGSRIMAGGDVVEVWDVRRGWIAKWSVCASAADSGITDIAFRDSHALWAQHSSGTFSQLDMRECIQPLDAIPRVSATWEASGSVAFVSDRRKSWEPPFDDVQPEMQRMARDRGIQLKSIRDGPHNPTSQNFGTFVDQWAKWDCEVLTKLARGSVIEGHDRKRICVINAEIAFEVGKHEPAQAWLLLSSLLPDPPPTPPPSPPTSRPNSRLLPRFVSAPAELPASYTFPSKLTPKPSPVRSTSAHADGVSHSTSKASSAPSSPHRLPSGLPSTTPTHSSALSRRESMDGGGLLLNRRPSISTYRNSSISPLGVNTNTTSPASDASKNNSTSHRHAGEGALSDSDSGKSTKGSGEEDGGLNRAKTGVGGLIHPSPLSRVAGWTEGVEEDDMQEEDQASPSPPSTDTESSGTSSPRRRRFRPRRASSRVAKSRSRSSTVASLAAPVLTRQQSHNSVSTVTAGEMSVREGDGESLSRGTNGGHLRKTSVELPGHSRKSSMDYLKDPRRKSVDRTRDLRRASTDQGIFPSHASHRSTKSRAFSADFGRDSRLEGGETEKDDKVEPWKRNDLSEERKIAISADEQKFREIGWDVLREAVDRFAVEGDVQTCALLSLVAAEELRVGKQRMLRFLESYIDILTRLRLHTSAAYLRKFSNVQDVRASTGLETIIHTMCGCCQKPMALPPGSARLKGGFEYCRSCRKHAVACSICHLPVRGLLFQCSVCSHGGHQECYRRYYMEHPMAEISPSSLMPLTDGDTDKRGHHLARGRTGSLSESDEERVLDIVNLESPIYLGKRYTLLGHLCASGCGHFCWEATANSY